MSDFRHVVLDVETNDLLPGLTTMHSLVLRCLDTDKVLSCTNSSPDYPSIESGLEAAAKAERIYGHNLLGFDIPAIQKLYPDWHPAGACLDTLIVCQMRWAHIKDTDFRRFKQGKLPAKYIGRHSLAAWGHRLGIPKGDVDDFSTWTPEMQTYCEQDTNVTAALVARIRKSGVSAESVETEQELSIYLRQQESNGWPFDVAKARDLHSTLVDLRENLTRELQQEITPWTVSLGTFTPGVNNAKRGYVKGVPIQKSKEIVFNPGSTHHIADRLQALYGWKPEKYTPSGLPECSEETLRGIDIPVVAKIRKYLTVAKRLGQLSEGKEGWLRHVTEDGKIHGKVRQSGTVTHRAAHWHPNLGQVPNTRALYGKECRELFHVPPGWKQLGVDVAGLELRCLAHYMARYDGGAYGELVLGRAPHDIHTRNAEILGLSRDDAKTWFYGWLYGAGDPKLGSVMRPGASDQECAKLGKQGRKVFLKALPVLGHLIEAVKASGKRRGYLLLIDGRRVYTRSEHSMLNSLLQGTGSVICKRWIVDYNRRMVQEFGPQGWGERWAALGWIHDEVQLAVRPEIADRAAEILLDSIRSMTQHFHFRVPLDGEAKIGTNWKDCH